MSIEEYDKAQAKSQLTVRTGHAIWAGDNVIVVGKQYDPAKGVVVISGEVLFTLVAAPTDTLIDRLKDKATYLEIGIDNLRNGKIWV